MNTAVKKEDDDEQVIVPGTEGTEFEGMSEEEIERKMFAEAVGEDPDLGDDDQPLDPPPKAEQEEEEEDEPEEKPEPEVKDPVPAPDGAMLDAPQPGAKEKPGKDAGEDAGEDAGDKTPTGLEWLDTLGDDIKDKARTFIDRQGQTIARLEQRVNSHLGQLQPAQRAISRLQKENTTLKQQLGKQHPSSSGSVDLDARIKAYNDYIDREYAEFPEEATKLKTQFAESLDGVREVLQHAAPPRKEEPSVVGPDPKEEYMHLSTAYSDWGERRFSPAFDQWLKSQDQDIQAKLNSPYASDNIQLLDAFTRDNPDWVPPQAPDDFYSVRQAQHSPLFKGWCEGEGINPDTDFSKMQDYERDGLLTRFKSDLGVVQKELEEPAPDSKVSKLHQRRAAQLKDRDPGSRRQGVKPGQIIDLNTHEGQKAYYDQLVASDPDLQ